MSIPWSRPFAAAAIFVASPASADWGNTHWGAGADAVVTAVGGDTEIIASDPGEDVWNTKLGASGSARFGGVAVRRLFFFDAKGGLAIVKLIPTDEDCPALRAAARRQFGNPATEGSRTIGRDTTRSEWMTWTSRSSDLAILYDNVHFNEINSDSCLLIYQPYGDGLSGERDADGKTILPIGAGRK